jgi:DNA-binding response OmpR family regulator
MTMLGESGFDLAVLDYHIPGVGPTRIVAHLRARAVEIPLIVVTADDSAATEREARALGVAYYFVKPFPMADLRAVAETIFASTGRPHSRVKR